MLKKMMVAFSTLLLAILVGCNHEVDTVSRDEISSLKISDYFPLADLQRTYINYGEGDTYYFSYDTVTAELNETEPKMYRIYEEGDSGFETVRKFEVSENKITAVHLDNPLGSKEINELVLTNKTAWDVGDGDHSESFLTAMNLHVTVPAGEFRDVIEVMNIVKIDDTSYVKKTYYAPTVGRIKEIFQSDDGGEFVALELHESNSDYLQSGEADDHPTSEAKEEPLEQEGMLTSIQYTNDTYGFTLEIPDSWLGVVHVEEAPSDEFGSHGVHFSYQPDEQIKQNIFSIRVYQEPLTEEYKQTSNEFYIGYFHNLDYTYVEPGEANPTLLEPENSEYLKRVQQMTYEELPEVIATMEFIQPESQSELGHTAENEYEKLLMSYYEDPNEFQRLLEQGANPNAEDEVSPILFSFSFSGDTEAVSMLLEYGADPDGSNSHNTTAVSMAATKGHLDVVKLLLEAGADPNIQDNSGHGALHVDMIGTEMGNVLERAGAVVQ